MEIIRIPRIMQDTSRGHLLHSRTIGFVPTMGALHEGHLSLVRMSKEENTVTAVSIFVNPSQFGPSEDFANYPRKIEEDIETLIKEDVDILFLPDNALMYPNGFTTVVEVKGLSDKMWVEPKTATTPHVKVKSNPITITIRSQWIPLCVL